MGLAEAAKVQLVLVVSTAIVVPVLGIVAVAPRIARQAVRALLVHAHRLGQPRHLVLARVTYRLMGPVEERTSTVSGSVERPGN